MSEKELYEKVGYLCLQYGVSDAFKQGLEKLIEEYLSKHTQAFKFDYSTLDKIIDEKFGKRVCPHCKKENSALAESCKFCKLQI